MSSENMRIQSRHMECANDEHGHKTQIPFDLCGLCSSNEMQHFRNNKCTGDLAEQQRNPQLLMSILAKSKTAVDVLNCVMRLVDHVPIST